MKTFTICIIIAFISLIATMFVMDTRAIFMDPFTISLITAICSVIGTIFIMETHAININNGVITIKAISISVKDFSAIVALSIVGTILAIIFVENLGVLQ